MTITHSLTHSLRIGVLLLFSSSASAAPVCDDVNSSPLGVQPAVWAYTFGGGTASATWSMAAGTGGFEVLASAPPNGSRSIYLFGSVSASHQLVPRLNSSLPTKVTMDVRADAGDILFTALDGSGTVVAAQTAFWNTTTAISLANSGGIATIIVSGGDEEDYVDNICLE